MTGPADQAPAEGRIVVYTCIAGGYDTKLQPVRASDEIEFVCFKDQASVKAPGWEIRPLASPPRLTSGHDINRYHKLFPHHLFPDRRWSIYLDGNIRFDGDWRVLVAAVEDAGAAIGAFVHPQAHTLNDEIAACARLNKFDARDLPLAREQIGAYAAQGLDLNTPISANYLLVRDHGSAALRQAMSLWWSQLFEYSNRDQISLQYTLFRGGLDWLALDREGGVDAALLRCVAHKRPLLVDLSRRIRRRLRRALG